MKTKIEKILSVQRPQLSETVRDPDFVFALSDAGGLSSQDLLKTASVDFAKPDELKK